MESDLQQFFTNIESENSGLTEKVSVLESEIVRITEYANSMEKSLEKQKKFHRKFADDVISSEKVRAQDCQEERKSLNERIVLLTKANRQLTKDLSFYKEAHAELAKFEAGCSSQSKQTINNQCAKSPSQSGSPRGTKSATLPECHHKSSKVLSKISEKLLLENKKLKVKLDNLSTTIRGLKANNNKLENFKKKIENKKLKFAQDSAELSNLISSSKIKNKITFNPEVLEKLGELSEYKF